MSLRAAALALALAAGVGAAPAAASVGDGAGAALRGRLARALARAGLAEAARRHWEGVLALDSADVEARAALAAFALRQGDEAAARAHLMALVAADPAGDRVEAALAAELVGAGEPAATARARAAYAVGAGLLAARDPGGARRHLVLALSLWPEYPAAWNDLGVALERLGEGEAGAGAYLEALASGPGEPGAALNLFWCLAERGDAVAAGGVLGCFLPPSEEEPGDVLAARGCAAGLRGDDEAAARLLTASLRARPGHGGTLYNLAVAEAHCGRVERALCRLSEAAAAGYDGSVLEAVLGVTAGDARMGRCTPNGRAGH